MEQTKFASIKRIWYLGEVEHRGTYIQDRTCTKCGKYEWREVE